VFSVAQWNETYGNTNTVNETEVVGCPSVQTWCYYIPAMTITQFLLGYAFTAVGYPIGITLIQTIFSKVLGPRPQVRRYGQIMHRVVHNIHEEQWETTFFAEIKFVCAHQ